MIIDITPGSILATRNTDEVGNNSPGWWNHLAVVSINGWVVEAQMDPDAVIAVPWERFEERYPEILGFTVIADQLKVAEAAITFVGLPYRRVASLFPRWRRPWLGENCVSVVRKTIVKATGRDPGWRRPDHAVDRAGGAAIFYHKIDYAGWVKPVTWFAGMTKEPQDLAGVAS